MKPHKTYTLNALAKMLQTDRRTLKRLCQDIKPAATKSDRSEYHLADVEKVLASAAKSSEGVKPLREAKLAEEVRKLRIRNDREEGRLIEKQRVAETVQRIFGALLPQIEQLLTNEYPTAVAGLDPAQARVYGGRVFDKFVAAHREFAKEWE